MWLAVLFLAGGCSSFNRDWNKAARWPVPANGIEGRWAGTWKSDVNGHNGQLLCVVTPRGHGTYRAYFHATYHGTLKFSYVVPLKGAESGGVCEFSGEANLHWWAGGVYTYEGRANGTNFVSTYHCKYDHGTFQMDRPAETTKPAAAP